MNELYNRISLVADQRITTTPFLNQWVRKGQPINKIRFYELITGLQSHKRYDLALQLYVYICVYIEMGF
ncbi:hypothetical protein Peur_028052 [Populus x canadensis]